MKQVRRVWPVLGAENRRREGAEVLSLGVMPRVWERQIQKYPEWQRPQSRLLNSLPGDVVPFHRIRELSQGNLDPEEHLQDGRRQA